ncbi:hypothetical protein LX32DRAFT_729210 [Colletotrichum zoysiae]|uniref:Uncharacterized protein n=1 Tax=Colletotrichum zoysiae TaxID=1216348 RepID=A0AAD9HGW7_9PEZI|nr:hypothetical protein LX32DRAFT_729210 [Colletotrichum zoysiae]
MCLAEHIYYINCGCWEGRHIRWQCPRGSAHGAGACPEVVCSGVFRKWGRCLVCQRRQAQQRRQQQQQQHVLVTGANDEGDACGGAPAFNQRRARATRDARRESVSSQRPGTAEWHRRFDPCASDSEAHCTGEVAPRPKRWSLDRYYCCPRRAGSRQHCGNEEAALSDWTRGWDRRNDLRRLDDEGHGPAGSAPPLTGVYGSATLDEDRLAGG